MAKAIGTEADSIIFDKYAEERWEGFTLESVTNATEFQYVRISGSIDGGIYLNYSDPLLTHVTISDNRAFSGGGEAAPRGGAASWRAQGGGCGRDFES